MKMTKKRIIIIASVLAVLLIGAGSYFLFFKNDKSSPNTEEPSKKYYSKLTGVEVSKEVSERPVLGVMIENSEFARPQNGLGSAGIVFEAVTEGGITRYLALYQENMPEIVGPVRSVRPHFVDWVMGFDAAVAHVGGSSAALDLLDQRNAKDLTQFKYPEPYYRDDKREAPHNMYARTADLQKLEAKLGYKTSVFDELPRSDDAPASQPQAKSIKIDFSSPTFAVEYRYDPATNSYTRYLAGEAQIDIATKKPIMVKNVIVVKSTGQSEGVGSTGSGDALLFKDGNVTEIKWSNPDYKGRMKFIKKEGGEVPLNRGNTWIAVIASDRTVSY